VKTVFLTVERASWDADLIIHSFLMTHAGHTLARLQGVPDVSAQFFPVFVPRSAFPTVRGPHGPRRGGLSAAGLGWSAAR